MRAPPAVPVPVDAGETTPFTDPEEGTGRQEQFGQQANPSGPLPHSGNSDSIRNGGGRTPHTPVEDGSPSEPDDATMMKAEFAVAVSCKAGHLNGAYLVLKREEESDGSPPRQKMARVLNRTVLCVDGVEVSPLIDRVAGGG